MPHKDPERNRLSQLRWKQAHPGYHRVANTKYGKSKKGIAKRLVSYKKHVAEHHAKVWAIKAGPCTDCGHTFHPEAMEFDHVRGVKYKNISQLIVQRTSVKRLDEELLKCDLVCANCHRVRTYNRRVAELKSNCG